MTEDRQKYKRKQFVIEKSHKKDEKFSSLENIMDPDPAKRNTWFRIRSISDRIRNPACWYDFLYY